MSDPSTAPAYDGYATWKGWDRLFSCDAEAADYFAGETAGLPVRGARVLEIGFGAGSFLAWAKAQGAAVTGVETAPALVEAARIAGVAVLATEFEAEAERYAAGFDLIAAFDVFEHLTPAEVAAKLRASAVLLAPRGRLLLRYPNGQSPLGLPAQHGDATHLQALSRDKIEQLAAGAGLRTVRYAGAFRPPGRGIAQRLVRRCRYAAQDMVEAGLEALYRFDTPLAPVVVHVLART